MPEEKKETVKEGYYKLRLDKENKILEMSVIGKVDMFLINNLIEETNSLIKKVEKTIKLNCLINVRGVTRPILSAQSRKSMYDGIKDLLWRFNKIALFGGSTLVKVVTKFVFAAAGKKDVAFFATKEAALSWLKK